MSKLTVLRILYALNLSILILPLFEVKMPWKVGGNADAVWITCRTNWKECAIAIANYLWSEIVSDVVDYLANEGIIWILAIAITCTIVLRIKYRKSVHTKGIISSKRILSKVGHKIQDLELKMNILTYKMQYGTWPLPHQIYSLNPKKLQKIRLTASNPDNRKNWIKHALLRQVKGVCSNNNDNNNALNFSPTKSNMCVSYPNAFDPFVAKFNNFFDINRKCTHHVQRGKFSTDYNSIETSKSTSDQSANICSRRQSNCSQNVSTEESELNNIKNPVLQRPKAQILDSNKINHHHPETLLIQNDECTTSSTNAGYKLCQEFTDTVHKYRSFLKKLEYNNKRLHLLDGSLETGDIFSSKEARTIQQPVCFTKNNRREDRDTRVTAKEGINETKYSNRKNDKTVGNVEEIYRHGNISDDTIVLTNTAVPKRLPIGPIIKPTEIVQSSRETLYEVRKRLQSLHNVLRTYQDIGRYSKRKELLEDEASEIQEIRENKLDAFISAKAKKIEEYDTNSKEMRCLSMNSREYFESGHSEESLSSLSQCSSNISKICQCSSNVTSRNIHSIKLSQDDTARKPTWTDNLSAIVTTANSKKCTRHSLLCSTMFSTLACNEKGYEKHECKYDISNHERDHQSASRFINTDIMKTDIFNSREEKSETEKTRYIIPSDSIENKNIQTQNGTSLMTDFVTEKFLRKFDGEQYRENFKLTSQNNMLKNINKEEKSTILLLQKALHFKKALLARVELEKSSICNVIKENNIPNECPHEIQKQDNNFSSMILDGIVEEPNIKNGRLNQRYFEMEIDQGRDLFSRSLDEIHVHRENEMTTRNRNLIPKTSSEYFTISDITTHSGDETENNVPFSLKPSIYENMISIAIPINVESKTIDTNEKSMKLETVLKHTQKAGSCRDLRKSISADNINSNIANYHLLTMFKIEDLLLKRFRNIRNYTENFLQSQNTAISKTRRALEYRGHSDIFRHSNETDHVILHDRSVTSSDYENNIQVINIPTDTKQLDFLINTPSNFKREIFLKDDNLNYCPDLGLKRNPSIFTIHITPNKDKLPNKNIAQLPDIYEKLEKYKTNLNLSRTLELQNHEIDLKSKCKTMNLDSSNYKQYVTLNTLKNNEINDEITININADLRNVRENTVQQ